ncbi:MAG: hypothetical protein K8S25_11080, partial [Alphaproteobacteria bacterium]|nr:hypothetical protein [Alphaproteobacteria bacterium]
MGRAAKVDKAPDAPAVARIDGARRPGVAAAAVHCSVAVDFAPLIAPFKKQGRLTLRVERLAPKARFSKGSRNNDGASWSLASDELDDLTYQLAEGYDGDHTLAVRVISLVNGNTLAVLDYAVSPNSLAGALEVSATEPRPPARDDGSSDLLRAELAQIKSELGTRDLELAQLRQEIALAVVSAPTRDIDAELAGVREAAKTEVEQRLAAAAAQNALHLQQHREAWAGEHATRVADMNAQMQAQLADARDAGARDARGTFAAAEAKWKSETDARLSSL